MKILKMTLEAIIFTSFFVAVLLISVSINKENANDYGVECFGNRVSKIEILTMGFCVGMKNANNIR